MDLEIQDLPDSVILQILKYLSHVDVCHVAQTCWKLCRVSDDEILWRNLFHRHFRVESGIYVEPLCAESWRSEFKRLINETPMVETEELIKHSDQVLHVSFSHDGKRFATTAKDGFVSVWKSDHPVKLEFTKNMKTFSWKYTQYSQFNESDTLLLVSGVLFGLHSTSGEIAIFSLQDGFQLQCKTISKPYDIFGTWYSDTFFFSGELDWLGNMVSKSTISINRASQESQSERTAVISKMYKFYNPKASSVRSLMIANCSDNDESDISSDQKPEKESSQEVPVPGTSSKFSHTGNPVSNLPLDMITINSRGHKATLQGAFQNWRPLDNIADINYSAEYKKRRAQQFKSAKTSVGASTGASCAKNSTADGDEESISSVEDLLSLDDAEIIDDVSEASASSPDGEDGLGRENCSSEEDILDTRDKWLIFTCSSETYTPHRIGFKRIKPISFQSLDPGPSVKERIEEYKRRRRQELAGEGEEVVNWANYPDVKDRFDEIDHIVDLHGHIIGMTLSPDHRYLYVNSRPWPEGYKITDPLEPPPIASEIDIHVIDLKTITQVGMMKRAHRAYTPNEECFFIFLDACDQYVASGAEDKHGYVWDRHYGVSLVKLPHQDVVNSVAFNPADSQMLVSVSDDYSIKVWRSKGQCRSLGLDITTLKQGTTLYSTKKQTLHPFSNPTIPPVPNR